MDNSDHIVSLAESNIDSYSLQEKLLLFLAAFDRIKTLKQSKELLSEQIWADRLGSEEELEKAQSLLERDLEHWAAQFNQEEISKVQKTELLSGEELKELKAISAKIELQKLREIGKGKDNSSYQK